MLPVESGFPQGGFQPANQARESLLSEWCPAQGKGWGMSVHLTVEDHRTTAWTRLEKTLDIIESNL